MVVVTGAVLQSQTGWAADQRLHGQAGLEYQTVDRAGVLSPRESWIKTFQTDYGNRLPGAIEFTSQFRFSEQTVVGQPDRLRNPEVSLRLAHRYFGLSSSYRPSEVRDARDQTTRQQTFSLAGNLQAPRMPRLAGTWIRSHLDASAQSPSSATVTRTLSANYGPAKFAARAAYGDRLQEARAGLERRVTENHLNLGTSSQFQLGRAGVSLQYDFSQSRSFPSGVPSRLARSHAASATSSLRFSSRTSSSLVYSYRHTESRGGGSGIDEHNGAVTLSQQLTEAVQASGSAGVRSANFAGRTETERFVAAGASAQGKLREGWQCSASLGHSMNWLPHTSVRVSDSFQSNTSMRVIRGLVARGDLTLSTGRRPVVAADSVGPRDVSLQTGAGLTANPLRTVYLDASAFRNRTGPSLRGGGSPTTSYTSRLRLTPSSRLQMTGTWSLTYGRGNRGTTFQASTQWSLGSWVQASGSYSQSREHVPSLVGPSSTRQESFSGALVMALGKDRSGALRYSESNWGHPAHVRQLNASIVQSFGR